MVRSSTLGAGDAPGHLANPEAVEYFARKITPQVKQESPTPPDQIAEARALRFQNFEDNFGHVGGSNHGGFYFIIGELFQLLKPIVVRAVGGQRAAGDMTISSEKLRAAQTPAPPG